MIKKTKKKSEVMPNNQVSKSKKKIKTKRRHESIEEENKEVTAVQDVSSTFRISECGFVWNTNPSSTLEKNQESSSDSDDEVQMFPKLKKMKKLNPAERRELDRRKEREIREREEALASYEMPNSVDQFDRLIMASPGSSVIWIQYMAFHLQATEIDKARAIAKRALNTINYREDTEKLNVWKAWLNLESRFGSPETLNNVFHEAINANDDLQIHLHMLTIHTEAGRPIELEKMIKRITSKYKQLPEAWIECGAAFLKIGLKEKSRFTMQRALQSLPASEHVNLMVKFAVLETKFGEKERAWTLFEQILCSYPKRVDIWSVYVDMVIKSGNIDAARHILEKAVVQTLPPKKMKTLFAKFIKFEEDLGTTESAARAKKMAKDWVDKYTTNLEEKNNSM